MPNEPVTDPFADDKFAQHDLSSGPKSMLDALSPIVDEHPEFAPTDEEVIEADGLPEPVPVPAPVAPTPVPTPAVSNEPDVFEFPDGSNVSLQKTRKGWCATLDSGGKAPEKFYGDTKDALLTNVLAAKMHATQHIRELNKKLKLTARPTNAPVPQVQAVPQTRSLTTDEIYEIKNQLDSNPDLAMDTWFQRKTGLKVEQLLAIVDKGQHANEELESEGVARAFMAAQPGYYADPEFSNYLTIVGYLSKDKLRETMDMSSRDSVNATMRALIRGGFWTVENLEEAYEELTEAGLLESAPDALDEEDEEIPLPVVPRPAPVAPVAPVVQAPVVADPRIAARRVGPRAGLGIRASQTTAAPQPSANDRVSADELNNLSDTEIQELFSGVRRVAATRK